MDPVATEDGSIEQIFRDATKKTIDILRIKKVASLQGIKLTTIRSSREQNRTLLHVAAGFGRKSWVDGLITDGADVNAQDDEGQAPLHAACNHAHKKVAELLIEAGADVNATDNKGWTPLHFALTRKENADNIQPHYWEVVQLLLVHGADPYIKSNTGKNCFARIKDDEQRRCVRVAHIVNKLHNCDSEDQADHEAIIDKYLRVKDFFELVKKGDDNLELLKILLTPRLLESRLETLHNITPLHRAAGHNHLSLAKLFIESGANVNSTDDNGSIPLHNAAKWGHIDMIELLIHEGSDVNRRDLEGDSPIHFAASNTTFDACLKLIELGANINLRNDAGKLPYDLAEYDDVKEVLKPDQLIHMVRTQPSSFEQAIYMGYQEDNVNEMGDQSTHYKQIHDHLMLDSNSDERLFSNPKHQIKKIILAETDHRYQLVKKRMLDTIVHHDTDAGGRFSDYEIISIEHILHEKVWLKYRLMCQRLEIDYGRGSKNERLLFHGSSFIDKIQTCGFDERYAQRDGMFGAGIYFAAHSSKSNQYTFGFGKGCEKHQTKSCYSCERKMIYAQVALGKSLFSKEPTPSHSHAPPGYSSVTGSPEIIEDLRYPEYVIYSGDQAYPLFVITYRIKP